MPTPPATFRRSPHLATATAICGLTIAALMAGCAPTDRAVDQQADQTLSTPSGTGGAAPAAPSTAATPGEGDLTPGWDQSPDTPVPAESSMTPADWLALLRVPATAVATADTCTARQLAGSLDGFDAAAGHRYTQLVVTNVSAQPCTVQGYPGIGARGEWGSAFPMIVSQTDRSGTAGAEAEQPVITLQPGQSAAAAMEWTGELAGAQSEPIAVLVIQVAQGGDPIRVEPIVHLGDVSTADSADTQVPDIGMLTTVYVGAFLPA